MNEEQRNKENSSQQPKEIDLIELAQKIWANRKLVFKACGVGAIIGLIVAFSIPKEYETKVMLAPEATNKGGITGSMGALAAMAGINLGGVSGEDAISPELYPKLMSSTPFLLELLSARVVTKKGDLDTTLYDYMKDHQKSPWWSYILSAPFKALGWGVSLFKEKPRDGGLNKIDPFYLTKDQADVVKSINGCISSSVDKKTGVISFSVSMQDPLISASIADTVKNKLQEYITEYRTNKARKDLVFAEKLYKEAQQSYFKAQQAYAAYTDGNMNIVMARYKTEAERLQNEMTLAYGVYSQVAQQLQIVKAKVQEITPVYTVLQPASVSLKAASPKKVILLFGFIFLAALGTMAWILLIDKMKEWKTTK